MNVQEFVKNAITEIAAGVAEARDGLAEYSASAGSDKVYSYTRPQQAKAPPRDSRGAQSMPRAKISQWAYYRRT